MCSCEAFGIFLALISLLPLVLGHLVLIRLDRVSHAVQVRKVVRGLAVWAAPVQGRGEGGTQNLGPLNSFQNPNWKLKFVTSKAD